MLNALNVDNSPFDEPQLEQLKQSFSTLTEPQSQWLSGYLAGLHAREALSAQPTERTAAGPALSIFYASETGNGEAVAAELAASLGAAGFETELVSFDGFRPARIKKLRRAVFVISTHGEGDPPEDAAEVFDYLLAENAPRLPELQYRVLALGDRSYEHFCLAGRQFDERLQSLGAQAFGPRIDCDVDYAADSLAWQREVSDWVGEHRREAKAQPASPALTVLPSSRRWSRERPFSARLLRKGPLTDTGSGKDVHHIELSLEGSGIQYQPGDALGVWAPNDRGTVEALLQALDLAADASVEWADERTSLGTALTRHLEITRLTNETLSSWARLDETGGLASDYESLDPASRRLFLEQRQLLDIAEAYPAKVTAQQLVGLLRPLAPRSYSIASSREWVDDEVHLTVATLTSNATGATRFGVASRFLNHGLGPGEEVQVFLEPNRRFHLPDDPGAPLILIGAGTGIAPYRAFLQEIEARGDGPDTWLLFGNPHLRTDFLYQREWLRWREDGLLTRIDAAWSRDQQNKRYVQHLVEEQAAALAEWLDRGAHIYVCGALAMGAAVQKAVQTALARTRGWSPEKAAGAVTELRRAGRYHKDLY